ncbi:MAG: transketolase C-terminal domain-containing protein [Candidatus Diapherotrites archaeon]
MAWKGIECRAIAESLKGVGGMLRKSFQEKAATREGYGKAIREMGAQDKSVVAIDADLASSTKSLELKKTAPERFFYAGICEMNAVGVATGLTLEGKKAFVSSFAVFLTGRAFEIIRQSVCYGKVPVKIVGSHAGILTGKDGPTAQATEDIAIMRSLPGMNIIVPADAIEAEKAAWFMKDFNEPCYLRTNRDPTPIIFEEKKYRFEFGKAMELRKGKHATIIACGALVPIALETAELLEKKKISVSVINMHTIKPIDAKAIEKAARETKAIIAAEDHQTIGGLGSAIAEVLAEKNLKVKFKRIGLNNRFAESGDPTALYAKYGFSKENIAKTIEKMIKG